MLTPEQWNEVGRQASRIYSGLELELIEEIAVRIANTGLINEVARNDILIAQEMGLLYQDVIESVAKYNNSSVSQILEIFETAGVKSLNFDDSIYKEAGLNPIPIRQSKSMLQILQSTAMKTGSNLNNLVLTTAKTSQTAFYDAMNTAYLEVTTGVKSYSSAILDAIDRVSKNGVPVEYPSGYKTSIENACRMNIVTGVNQTCGKLQEMRADEMNWDLMELTAHPGARPEHEVWQGQIVSRSGQKGYLSFADIGYGQVDGFKGVNCRHDWYPYYEGNIRTFNNAELQSLKNQKVRYNGQEMTVYEAQQLQRKFERQIRNDKKDIAGLNGVLTSNSKDGKLIEEAKEKLLLKQTNLKDHSAVLDEFLKQTGRTKDVSRLAINKNVKRQYAQLTEEEYFELIDIHRANIKPEIRKAIYKTDWDNMQESNKYGYINSNYSGAINYLRRTGKSPYANIYVEEFNKTIDSLQKAIASNKLEKNIEVTRYLDLDWLQGKVSKNAYKEAKYNNDYKGVINELLNKIVPDNQFISTSATEHNNYKFRDLKMIVQVDKGTNAFVTENKMESEIIFDDSDILINEIKVDDDKLIMVVKLINRR